MDETKEQTEPTEMTKAEKFAKNPDNFIDVNDIIMACVRTEHGCSTLHGACKRMEMEIALTRLNYKTNNIFMTMDMANKMKKSEVSQIIGVHNGAPVYNGRVR